MLSNFIKKRVALIKTEDELNKYISRVRVSLSPLEQREEVIEYAKKIHSNLLPSENSHDLLLKLIEESSADIDDIQ